jgi:hypothetical protein
VRVVNLARLAREAARVGGTLEELLDFWTEPWTRTSSTRVRKGTTRLGGRIRRPIASPRAVAEAWGTATGWGCGG